MSRDVEDKVGIPKVLVIGPGEKVRGGISSVIRQHKNSSLWDTYKTVWIETYDDRGDIFKILAAIRAVFRTLIKIGSFDIVHIYMAHQNSAIRKSIFFLLAKLWRKKVIVHIHTSQEKFFHTKPFCLVRFLLSRSNMVIVISSQWRNEVRKYISESKIEYLPNSIVVPQRIINKREQRQEAVLFYAGKLSDEKGYLDLIQALKLVLQKFSRAKLRLAGHGDTIKGQRLAEKLGIESAVEFLGWLTAEEMDAEYDQADVFCLPSYFEGSPMVVLEAMGRGLPVVAYAVGGIPDMIRHEESGFLVRPGEVDTLGRVICRLLENPDLRFKLGKNAYLKVSREYCADEVFLKLGRLYSKLY